MVGILMGTVSKALELLNLFTRARPLIGLSDLARLAGVNKATCYRLMTELAQHGLVEQIGTGREYRLGPAVLRLASLREAHVPMRDAALPILQDLAQETGETTHLSILVGTELHPLAFAYAPTHVTKVTMEDTEVLPFHATSSGLAVLAFQPDAFREAVLTAPLIRLTAATETDVAALRLRLGQIAATGLAESEGGYEPDVASMAVPLFDALGRCSGGLSVAALASRMSPDQRTLIRAAILRAGEKITQSWGGTLPSAIAALWRGNAQGKGNP
jgi:DNA-binding IclR family transcriptional regulator